MSWFCSVCEKSFSRKDNMQRHVMFKHRNAGLTPFQTVPMSLQNMLAVSLRASLHLYDCRNDRVRKDGLGSISIATSFDFFLNQYEEAVKRPFGYLLIDLKTTRGTQDNRRLGTNVLPSEEGFNQAGFQ